MAKEIFMFYSLGTYAQTIKQWLKSASRNKALRVYITQLVGVILIAIAIFITGIYPLLAYIPPFLEKANSWTFSDFMRIVIVTPIALIIYMVYFFLLNLLLKAGKELIKLINKGP